ACWNSNWPGAMTILMKSGCSPRSGSEMHPFPQGAMRHSKRNVLVLEEKRLRRLYAGGTAIVLQSRGC
ncbi:hypothetical protein JW916_10745, partial [Candidatus Sumerlaeota bacterium]|nr:hypothetical protein [Candidatus Sumerlaeota bacterium]